MIQDPNSVPKLPFKHRYVMYLIQRVDELFEIIFSYVQQHISNTLLWNTPYTKIREHFNEEDSCRVLLFRDVRHFTYFHCLYDIKYVSMIICYSFFNILNTLHHLQLFMFFFLC